MALIEKYTLEEIEQRWENQVEGTLWVCKGESEEETRRAVAIRALLVVVATLIGVSLVVAVFIPLIYKALNRKRGEKTTERRTFYHRKRRLIFNQIEAV